MNKYIVETDIFADIKKGETITYNSRNAIWLDEDGAVVFTDMEIVERNPQWFKEIIEKSEWEVAHSAIHGFFYVTNGDVSIKQQKGRYSFSFNKEQAETICNALNELDNESQ